MMRKKLIITFICFIGFIFAYLKFDVLANTDTLTSGAKASILIELHTGEILYEKNIHEKLAPASMTKIMSTHLIIDALVSGQIKMEDIVTVSAHAASFGGSQVWLETGEQMSVEDLFKCMVIASANDATVALAELVAGSEDLFVQRMNKKVQDLGLINTHFVDPTGLSDFETGHYSSAYDMAMMARGLLLEHEALTTKYSSIYEDYIRQDTNDPFWLVNTNKLVNHVPGIDGLKTGWTRKAGYNLTATMKKAGMRLISVVMGEETPSKRNYDTVSLLNYGFSQYEAVEYKSKGYHIGDYDNLLLTPQKVKIVTKEPIYFLTKKGVKPSGLEENFTYYIDKSGVKKGSEIGKLEIIKKGKVVYTVPLTVEQDCRRASFFQVIGRVLKTVLFK